MATENQLNALSQALSFDRPPFCSGTISPSSEGFHLYYGNRDPKFIDFASATAEELDQLTAACEPATFGRGNEDVYDETYRKAGKMDASNFSAKLDPISSGLIQTIERQLVPIEAENAMLIKAEVYKLNVYGKDSFFKPHKDTPRGTDMVGSLVIVYPTPHQGGELVLRHKGREWEIDASTLTHSQPSTSIAYVAFYSDIEHEVLKVSSGCRITLTYNLYLADSTPGAQAPSVVPNLRDILNFQSALHKLLGSPEFLPHGGTLGFGLAHLYPITFETKLQDMVKYLKGEDAHVYRACQESKLQPSLRMVYDCEEARGVMLKKVVELADYSYQETNYIEYLCYELGGTPVNLSNKTLARRSDWVQHHRVEKWEQITWVTPFREGNRLRDVSMAYGNDAVSLEYAYHSPCLCVPVAPASDRVSP